MTVGIVGLGLIGGSFAKAYHQAGHRVLALEKDPSVLDFAILSGAVQGALTPEEIPQCDLILVAVYPAAAVEFFRENADRFGDKPLVMDCCGVKREVCDAVFPLAREKGFTFLGGHPMAGTHNSGFKYATADLFRRAPMVLVPDSFHDIQLLSRAKALLEPAGFARFSVTTAQEHDKMIAFTSQLAHVVSNAYIKSPTARLHRGFSAGSYKDMTRVAWLNPTMWAELFLEDKDFLLEELDTLMASLAQYREAIAGDDLPRLTALLDDGKRCKEEVDGH